MPSLCYSKDLRGRFDVGFMQHLVDSAPKDVEAMEAYIKLCEDQLALIGSTGFKTVVEVVREKSYEYPTYGHISFKVVEKRIPIIPGCRYDEYNYRPVDLFHFEGKEWDLTLRHLSGPRKELATFTGKERVKAIKFAKEHAAKVNGDAVYGRD